MSSRPSEEIPPVIEEMLSLLKHVASIQAPDRSTAVRYTECRARLMSSRFGPAAPGFLVQCVSVFKFRDFINLFAPDLPTREAFIDQAFAGCGHVASRTRRFDVFGEER